jgi:LacI family transcriptional regulator
MTDRSRRATLQQIAEEIGISISTVSRALNNRAQIDAGTRVRVQEVAERIGYRVGRGEEPRERGMAIAVITSAASPVAEPPATGRAQSDHIQRMVFTFEQVAGELGHHIVLNSDTGVPNVLPSSIRTHFADGALLLGGQFDDALVEQIAREVPTVFVASFLPSGAAHAVYADYRAGVLLALGHLVAQGHRRIGFINGAMNTNTSRMKLAGYLQACFEHGLPVDPRDIVNADNFNLQCGARAAEELLARGSYTALVCASDVLARGALQFARSRGVSVPEQLSLVSLYNDAADHLYPDPLSLSRVYLDHSLLARLAITQLLQVVAQPGLPPVGIVVPVAFAAGTSSAPPQP